MEIEFRFVGFVFGGVGEDFRCSFFRFCLFNVMFRFCCDIDYFIGFFSVLFILVVFFRSSLFFGRGYRGFFEGLAMFCVLICYIGVFIL